MYYQYNIPYTPPLSSTAVVIVSLNTDIYTLHEVLGNLQHARSQYDIHLASLGFNEILDIMSDV